MQKSFEAPIGTETLHLCSNAKIAYKSHLQTRYVLGIPKLRKLSVKIPYKCFS